MISNLHTTGQMAAALNVRTYRVRYILETRTEIKPVGRAGIAWLYDDAALEAIRLEIEAINQKTSGAMA